MTQPPDLTDLTARLAQVEREIAAAHAERDELRADLDAAQRRIVDLDRGGAQIIAAARDLRVAVERTFPAASSVLSNELGALDRALGVAQPPAPTETREQAIAACARARTATLLPWQEIAHDWYKHRPTEDEPHVVAHVFQYDIGFAWQVYDLARRVSGHGTAATLAAAQDAADEYLRANATALRVRLPGKEKA